jgi:translocation and assembly module TamB
VSLPVEVKLTNQKSKDLSLPLNLNLQLALALGDDVSVAYDKFEGKVAGKLTIHQTSGYPATAIGQIRATKGVYRTYGKTLKISDARLTYSGNALNNPGIYIRAQKKFASVSIQQAHSNFTSDTGLQTAYGGESDITVGVQLTGSIQKPVVSLFSLPLGMKQTDILSYLMFGHPQAQSQNAGAILSALSGVYTSDSKLGGITDQVKSTFALTDLGLDSADIYDPTKNTVVPTTTIGIGKKLGHNLYLRFQVGVTSPVSILNVRYQLSKHFSLQSETSTNENGADLFYTIETD